MSFVRAEVEVQGDSLVVKDAKSGDCLVVDVTALFDHYDPHEDSQMPYDRLEAIFGPEVFDR